MSQSLEDRMRVLELVAQVLVVDFAITLEEDAFFDRLVERFALTSAHRAAVVERVNIGVEVESVVAELGADARTGLMRTLAEAAAVDGNVAEREIDVINRIGTVLRIQAAHPGLSPREA